MKFKFNVMNLNSPIIKGLMLIKVDALQVLPPHISFPAMTAQQTRITFPIMALNKELKVNILQTV